MEDSDLQRKSTYLAIAAFAWWGFAPMFFKQLPNFDAYEFMAHRIVWSLFTIVPFMWLMKKKFKLLEIIRTPSVFYGLLASSCLISFNWFIFVLAIANNQLLATSLGYFINPLISVVLGMFFLNEKLSTRQYIALTLVVMAIVNQIWQFGELPWLSLSLAFSFGFYGLLRKKIKVDSFNGLLVEIIVAFPFACGFLIWKFMTSTSGSFMPKESADIIIIFSGIITIVPMALFAESVKGIKLSTVGFIQYLAPSITFMLAIFLYNEPLGSHQLFSFSLIWVALALISLDALKMKVRAKN